MKQIYFLLLLIFSSIALIGQIPQQEISYTYDQAGNRISRKVVDLKSNKVKSNFSSTDSVVVKESIRERTITVFPNPTRGALGIDIQGGDSETEMRLILYSATGTVLYNRPGKQGINPVDMTNYPQGWYILLILSGNEKREYKIVKE